MRRWPGRGSAIPPSGWGSRSRSPFRCSPDAVGPAALNLYCSRAGALEPLTAAVRAAYDSDDRESPNHDLDVGGRELTAGLIEALALRGMIEQAIGVLISITGRTAEWAHLTLRLQAAESGIPLTETAVHLIEQQQP
jgi:hypothetical protein